MPANSTIFEADAALGPKRNAQVLVAVTGVTLVVMEDHSATTLTIITLI